jgi:hypothetical protein
MNSLENSKKQASYKLFYIFPISLASKSTSASCQNSPRQILCRRITMYMSESNIQAIIDGDHNPPPPNIYSMALLTLPPVASKALMFCDALMKPISCSCCSCTWNRSSGGRVSEGGRGVEPYDPKPPAPGPPKAPSPSICCMRAGSKPSPGAGLASDEPVVALGVALACASGGGRRAKQGERI